MVCRLKCQIFHQWRHSAIFFISFKIKPDVTFTGFTNKNRIFTTFWYQNCQTCKVVLPIQIWIWLKYSWNLLMCAPVAITTFRFPQLYYERSEQGILYSICSTIPPRNMCVVCKFAPSQSWHWKSNREIQEMPQEANELWADSLLAKWGQSFFENNNIWIFKGMTWKFRGVHGPPYLFTMTWWFPEVVHLFKCNLMIFRGGSPNFLDFQMWATF